jgi:hypothetical protein
MPIPLFLTLGMDEHYGGMVRDHEPRHRAYCDRWGYEYAAVTAPPVGGVNSWTRHEHILRAMKSGRYSHVFSVDADAFVADLGRDMRETLPPWAWLAMTVHPYHWKSWEPFHLQAGMFYFRTCPESIAFLETMLSRRQHFPDDQLAVNFLMIQGAEAVHWQQGLRILPYQWNCTLHDMKNDPIVAAFHGHLGAAARRVEMRAAAERYPWRA